MQFALLPEAEQHQRVRNLARQGWSAAEIGKLLGIHVRQVAQIIATSQSAP